VRTFRRPGGIDKLSLEARIVYTAFCVFLAVGYASSAWFYLDDHLGIAPAGAARYYLGTSDRSAAAHPANAAAGGPSLELPGAPDPAAAAFEKAPRQVMETFHFHLFSVALCLLVVAHLFMMCHALSTRAKTAVIALGSAATLLHLLAPPLIRFGSPACAGLMFPSAVGMTAGWLAMTALPLYEMWRPEPESGPAEAGSEGHT
jgi:hypothetical protein